MAKECWASCLVTCLSGDYLSMWASYVDSHEDADYDAIKAYFLNRVGLNWDSRSRLISCPRKPSNLTWDQYFYQCVEDLKLLTDGAASVEEACNLITKALFCNFIKGASRTDLTRKKDLPMHEFLQAFMDSIHLNRSFYDSNEQKGSYSHYDRRQYRSSETGPASEKANVKSDIRDSKGSEESSGCGQFPSNIICHNCGEAGHIRPNCPKLDRKPRKIGYVSTGSLTDGSQPVIGLVNGIKTTSY